MRWADFWPTPGRHFNDAISSSRLDDDIDLKGQFKAGGQVQSRRHFLHRRLI